MRQLLSICLLFSICIVSTAQQTGFEKLNVKIDNSIIELYSQSHALLIGVSEYSYWPDLPGVKQDIFAVQTTLEQHDFNVVIVENPTKQELDRAISDFIARYGQGANNRLLFYFAGHGHTINTSYGGKLGYFVPSDAPNPNNNEASFQSNAIEMAQIEIYAKRIQSKHAFFMFDACFSGSLFALTRAIPQIISYKTTEPVRQFITSGTENEQVPDVSIFRQQFIIALTSDNADGNKDGYLTGTELGEFLQTTVTNYTYNYQHPQFGKIRNPMLDKGDFVFILPGNQSANTIKNDIKDPVLGEAKSIPTFGSIELSSEINGKLYLDGKELGEINANIKIPINKVTTGEHLIQIIGPENWSRNITVYKDQSTLLTAVSSNSPDKYEFARSGAFTDPRYNEDYKWIKIGRQIWMAENLNHKTTDGSWCIDDDESNCNTYGRLYSWDEANKVCPVGWHLPSDNEWKELERALGMSIAETEKRSYRGKKEGGKLKATGLTHWLAPNRGSTNESDFSALPAGYRNNIGDYLSVGRCSLFWTSTEAGGGLAPCRELYYTRSNIYRDYSDKNFGFSVRCIKD